MAPSKRSKTTSKSDAPRRGRPRRVVDGRYHTFTMRLTTEERAMVEAVAVRAGLNASDYLRQHIRQRYGEVIGTRKGATK